MKNLIAFITGMLFAIVGLGAMPILLVKMIINEVFTLF